MFERHVVSARQLDVIYHWACDRYPTVVPQVTRLAKEWYESGACWWDGTDRCLVNLKPIGDALELHFLALPGGLLDAFFIMAGFGYVIWPALGYPEIFTENPNRALWRVMRAHGRRIATIVGAEFSEPTPGKFIWRRHHA